MIYIDYQTNARYVQCENAIQEIKRYTYGLGKKYLVFTACGPLTESITSTIKKSFDSKMEDMLIPEICEYNARYNRQIAEAKRFDEKQNECKIVFKNLEGCEVTFDTINELCKLVEDENYDVIIGVGGGKALDFTRGTAFYTGVKCVLVPTVASTNAAATQICIINSNDGKNQEGYLFLPNYPDLVLVDTSIVVNTPATLLSAGIADQLGSYYECLYSARRLEAKYNHSDLSWAFVKTCVELLLKNGKAAFDSSKENITSRAFDTIVSLILHNVGPARAVSGSGLAHTLSKALVKLDGCKVTHGMQIGYSIIPMMVAEREPEGRILEYIEFADSIDLPISIDEVYPDGYDKDELIRACEIVCSKPSAEVPFTAEELISSIDTAEAISRRYRDGKK